MKTIRAIRIPGFWKIDGPLPVESGLSRPAAIGQKRTFGSGGSRRAGPFDRRLLTSLGGHGGVKKLDEILNTLLSDLRVG